jgi:hypothetical protein
MKGGPAMRTDTIAEILRRNISESGLPAAVISVPTGVASYTISEFMHGGDIPLSTAQRLIDYFGNITITRNKN